MKQFADFKWFLFDKNIPCFNKKTGKNLIAPLLISEKDDIKCSFCNENLDEKSTKCTVCKKVVHDHSECSIPREFKDGAIFSDNKVCRSCLCHKCRMPRTELRHVCICKICHRKVLKPEVCVGCKGVMHSTCGSVPLDGPENFFCASCTTAKGECAWV